MIRQFSILQKKSRKFFYDKQINTDQIPDSQLDGDIKDRCYIKQIIAPKEDHTADMSRKGKVKFNYIIEICKR